VTDKQKFDLHTHSERHVAFPATGYVRLKQILSPEGPLPISRSGFWAGIKTGRFPRPRKISPRVTVWRAEDIHRLMNEIEAGERSA